MQLSINKRKYRSIYFQFIFGIIRIRIRCTVIIRKKGDAGNKAVTQLAYTGQPVVIGSGEASGYELYVYMGKKKAPIVLEEGKDFYIDYSNNVNAGKATVMLNGCAGGEYYGSKIFTFKIVKGKMRWAK